MSDIALNKWLFRVLNMAPLLEELKSIYDEKLDKGITMASVRNLKESLADDIGKVLNWIRLAPIMYDKPEADLASLHFSGAFGKGIPDPSAYDVVCSREVATFNLDVYKKIRSAFTVEELEQIDSREGKYSVLYILTGYYINAYYDVVAKVLQRAGLHYYLLRNSRAMVQDKLDWTLEQLTGERYKQYLDTDGSVPPSKFERMSLLTKKFCDSKIKKEMGEFLDEIRKDFVIGTKACSKREFCQIVFVFTKYMDCWNVKKYATNRHLLSKYYGIPEPSYKIAECKKFEKTEDGKMLIRKIQEFCAKR